MCTYAIYADKNVILFNLINDFFGSFKFSHTPFVGKWGYEILLEKNR
jgi:hypothetical protein